jgi:hypothetical protein
MTGGYNTISVGQTYCSADFDSIDLIQGQNGTKGILLTHLEVLRDNNDYTKWHLKAYRKNQLKGNNYGYYFFIDGLGTASDFRRFDDLNYSYGDCPYSSISASECLVDPNIPLRYTLQNAFDGDPATSYVENTEDDLILIRITSGAQKVAIINGYAQNMDLYMNNNRAKKLIWPSEIELADGMLDYQFAKIPHGQEFKVSEIYKGNKYNDTCIAEINIKTENRWLFGDINDE